MARNDYYVLLGVETSTSRTQIRRAFRKLARKYHPDINPGDNVAAVRYQRIAEVLQKASYRLAEFMYEKAGESGADASQAAEGSRSDGEDVIDAEIVDSDEKK